MGVKDAFPEQMEFDPWDESSVHFIVRHKASGDWLGGVRLVTSINSSFPFEEWNEPYQKLKDSERKQAFEMSRLCIVKEARRFSSKRFAPYGLPDEVSEESNKVTSIFNFKNQSSSLMWGLIRAAGLYSAESGITDWYFLVTPALAHLLKRGGLDLRQIGDACEHRGLRVPHQLSVESVLNNPLLRESYKADYRHYSGLTDGFSYKISACS